MTTAETAKYLSISEYTVREMAKSGKLPAAKIGSVWRFNSIKIDEFLSRPKLKREIKPKAHISSLYLDRMHGYKNL